MVERDKTLAIIVFRSVFVGLKCDHIWRKRAKIEIYAFKEEPNMPNYYNTQMLVASMGLNNQVNEKIFWPDGTPKEEGSTRRDQSLRKRDNLEWSIKVRLSSYH
ncbi:hypothetical protein TNIN_34371 [Trichonephila inaurata madagascariensis]|uniref:Uncharacterized protein n=1 Tax=Trichonephila inaurata madagascariensis TaxID=2747483 RepID=A0A8X6XRG7_9ARAC|nr:hypothetical protein TNIN_34371 [Trichonephila inaurata madagascariensis]